MANFDDLSSEPPGDPVKTCGDAAAFDPSYTISQVPPDLTPDASAVNGYMPKPGTPFSKEKWGVDWTDPEKVAECKAVRLDYHQGLADEAAWVEGLRQSGETEESIARKIVDIRNNARMSKYTAEELPRLYERNLTKYDTKFGPSYEFQLDEYGSPTKVIAAALRSNKSMDILTGIATVKGA